MYFCKKKKQLFTESFFKEVLFFVIVISVSINRYITLNRILIVCKYKVMGVI